MKNQAFIFLIIGLLVGIGGTTLAMRNKTTSTTTATPANGMTGMSHEMSASSTDMSSMSMSEMKNELSGLTGDAFDKKFISEMIAHHQGAIDMATLAKSQAKHPKVKDLADGIISAQASEIATMKEWQKNWGY